jgi:hypothetical protein
VTDRQAKIDEFCEGCKKLLDEYLASQNRQSGSPPDIGFTSTQLHNELDVFREDGARYGAQDFWRARTRIGALLKGVPDSLAPLRDVVKKALADLPDPPLATSPR